MNQFEDLPIGIDLGTTFSCIGVYRNDAVEIIPNEIGERITPSAVAFINDEIYVGEQIQYINLEDPKNKVYAIKRIIGRNYKDKEVQEDISNFSFKVINDDGKPKIKINSQRFSPEEISAKVLAKLKESAEDFLQKPIKKVVITVPAYFTERQKTATKNAGEIAGLDVIKIINEPTAASLAYGFGKSNNNINNNFLNLNKKSEKEIQKILVFDLGGGTLDVTLLELEKDGIRVKAHSGIMHLGGEDFDNIIVNYCINKFKNQTKIDLNREEYSKGKYRLKEICEKAKKELTYTTEFEIEVESIAHGKDLNVNLTRAKFETLCKELFLKCKEPIKDVLEIADEKKENIDEIVLIGGSTRIPKIQNILKEFFNGKELNFYLNPDEAVAYGATIEAAIEMQKYSDSVNLLDVCPFSLGVGVTEEDLLNEYGLLMETIIKRGSKLPFRAMRRYTPVIDYQSSVLINVYEGENKLVNENYFLGKFTLDNIPMKKKEKIHIDIYFDLDEDSILTVTGIIKENNCSNSIKIKNDKGGLSKNEILSSRENLKRERNNARFKSLMNNERNYKKIINNSYNKLKNETNLTVLHNELPKLRDSIEKYIDSFSKDIKDNFTLKEKLHYYLTYLFEVYSRLFNLNIVANKEKDIIFSKIKNYLDKYKDNDLSYYPSLLKLFINNDNNIFGKICIHILRNYLNKGKKLKENNEKKLAKFYLEEVLSINKRYFLEQKLKSYNKTLKESLDSILKESFILINSIKAELIEIFSPSFCNNKLIDEKEFKNEQQILKILDKFKEALRYLKDSKNKEDNLLKSIYYANIIKIEYVIFKSNNYESLLRMIQQCISLKEDSDDQSSPFWFNEINKYKREIEKKKKNSNDIDEDKDIKEELRKKNIFKKIDDYYDKGEIEFFYYILKNHKPIGLEQSISFNTKKDILNEFNSDNRKFMNKIIKLYNPQKYKGDKLESRKQHLIMQYIAKKLNVLDSEISFYNKKEKIGIKSLKSE